MYRRGWRSAELAAREGGNIASSSPERGSTVYRLGSFSTDSPYKALISFSGSLGVYMAGGRSVFGGGSWG